MNLLLLAAALAATTPAADPTYTALRAVRPQTPGVLVQGLVLERDVVRLRFDSGAFFFLAPVEGRTVGAVFIGKGGYELTPAMESERKHLRRLLEEPSLSVLADDFERVVLLFTDDTGAEIQKGAVPGGTVKPGTDPASVFDAHLAVQKKRYHLNFHTRLLADVLEKTSPAAGVFMAFVDGKERPAGLLAVDPRGLESMNVGGLLGGESTTFHALDGSRRGFWYLSRSKADLAAGTPPAPSSPVDARHYEVDTRIQKNSDLAGTTVLDLDVVREGVRVVPLALLPKLRVESAVASVAGGPFRDVAVIQEDAKEDADAAVVLPEPLAAGTRLALKVAYRGDEVLENYGDGNYVVQARDSWYPNVGSFSDTATFDLSYRVPKKNEVVSVGRAVESKTEGESTVFRFKAEHPIRVAGFNYGRFKKLVRNDGGINLQVFTNPGMPTFAEDIAELDEFVNFDTTRFAQSALADGINAARTCTHFFGPLPYPEVNITQQTQWSFGQSWPSLIYLPYLSFLDSTTRLRLGLIEITDFVELVGPHELAHQWWGHHIGWFSYRDQWISEGFAEFTAALVAEQTGGMKKYVSFWEQARDRILKKWPGNTYGNWEVGPISQGWRVQAGERMEGAYSAVVYTKGAYVLHMLRMLMRDIKAKDPDHRFIAMMKDFTSTWAGKNPSNLDFQAAVERHMAPQMDLAKNGKMDWFFRQWVHGTEVPRYSAKIGFEAAGEGAYRLTGEVVQSGVSDDFLAYVPLYVDFGKDVTVPLGGVALKGNATTPINVTVRLPQKPKSIRINALLDVLSWDQN